MYKTRILVEGTVVAALSLVLSFIPTTIGSSFTISLGMIPMTLFALRRGLKPALMAAFIWGILHFPASQVVYLSVVQVLIEYPIAFTFAGFAGLYAKKVQQALVEQDVRKARKMIILGSFVGTSTRFFWHFIAGVVFWGSYALWGMNPWLFSLVMNGVSGLATAIVTAIVAVLVAEKAPQLYLPKDGLLVQRKSQ
ncbi:energy-coupled thiamine transporter ThiT [Enterococcus dongliensis]|uniref:Energy-coupled thiamine transporter ThiT n=1 Tax=Enterococcus dongliensis TaxID=2559925 RepID=A0AAP5NKJ1_9ENTE|nr:energy-coupled thiamine transporter ThiT [Enterococcus dongliensis]MDT2596477.1 energy-coupled thiamine transporter ThiT [Enterococcus dongliensis]MDT2604099.1 energy-coupled thiamine transporter ThiT [Enterococcus dongliensis]MDT2634519.1 energy-coupled thiamine transporter ThiT [Enterococcus dongliensis]MDT2636469.1 energy-coupled thiamine transporter ThiT [Enterococcus dongliensis]MDT2642145.1 energy-coupled thiamine transporter ThiT [Enterococcus dongliensis]